MSQDVTQDAGHHPSAPPDDPGPIMVRLDYRPPLHAEALLGWLSARAAPGVEEVSGGVYRRSLRLPRSAAVVEMTLAGGHDGNSGGTDGAQVALRLFGVDPADLPAACGLCRRVADLDTDPAAVAATLSTDPALAPLVAARPGLRVPGTVDGFELACRAILGQQVTVAGARTLAGRLVAQFGRPLAGRPMTQFGRPLAGRPKTQFGRPLAGRPKTQFARTLPAARGSISHLFPTADRLAGASHAELTGLGLTGARAGALLALAGAMAGGELVLDPDTDRDEATRRLLALPGVGPWTVAYVAMRALGDPDALPAGDLILRRALPASEAAAPLTAAALTKRSARWRPHRAYAAMHLWASTVP